MEYEVIRVNSIDYLLFKVDKDEFDEELCNLIKEVNSDLKILFIIK